MHCAAGGGSWLAGSVAWFDPWMLSLGNKTADLSTALRSGPNDEVVKQRTSVSWGRKTGGCHDFVVSSKRFA
jgi:hypothetical protein